LLKNRSGIQTFFSTTTYAAIPYLGVLNRVLCTRLHPHRLRHYRAWVFFSLIAEKSKPPALRVVGDTEYNYGKRCILLGLKITLDSKRFAYALEN